MSKVLATNDADGRVILAGKPKTITFTDVYYDKRKHYSNACLCVLSSRHEHFRLAFMQKGEDGTFQAIANGEFAEVGVSAIEALKAMMAFDTESEFTISDSGSEYDLVLPYRVHRLFRIHARDWPLPFSTDELLAELNKFAVNDDEKSFFFGEVVSNALRRLEPTESSERFS